jgi:hypothetical protein
MKSLQVELRSVKSFCVYRSEIPASVATSHGPKSGSAKPSLMMPRIRANSLSACGIVICRFFSLTLMVR